MKRELKLHLIPHAVSILYFFEKDRLEFYFFHGSLKGIQMFLVKNIGLSLSKI